MGVRTERVLESLQVNDESFELSVTRNEEPPVDNRSFDERKSMQLFLCLLNGCAVIEVVIS